MSAAIAVYNKYGRKISSRKRAILYYGCGLYREYRERFRRLLYVCGLRNGINKIWISDDPWTPGEPVIRYSKDMDLLKVLNNGYSVKMDASIDYNKLIRDIYGLDKMYEIPNIEYKLSILANSVAYDFECLTLLKCVSRKLRSYVIEKYPALQYIMYVPIDSPLLKSTHNIYQPIAFMKYIRKYTDDIFTIRNQSLHPITRYVCTNLVAYTNNKDIIITSLNRDPNILDCKNMLEPYLHRGYKSAPKYELNLEESHQLVYGCSGAGYIYWIGNHPYDVYDHDLNSKVINFDYSVQRIRNCNSIDKVFENVPRDISVHTTMCTRKIIDAFIFAYSSGDYNEPSAYEISMCNNEEDLLIWKY